METTYSAFISYRHLPLDSAAAKAVQKALETYRIPKEIRKKTGVQKLKRCFRDQDELPLADDLGSSIQKALTASDWLIVICSPDLPHSRWCLREVDYFIRLGRRDRIIPVLVRGEPGESYPPQILQADTEQGMEETEPLAADIRGSMRRKLKTEKLRIAARMLNLNFNDLKRRERERAMHRGLALVSGALVLAAGFSVYAVYKNRLLTEERNATARNATELLLEKSLRSTGENEIGNGLTYALEAYEGSRIFSDAYDAQVSAALEAALYPEMYAQLGTLKDHGVLHRKACLSNDGSLIACRQADNSLQMYSSVTGERLYTLPDFGWYLAPTPLTPDSRYVFRCGQDGTLTLCSAADGKEVLTAALPDGWTFSVYGMTSDNRVPVQSTEGKAALFDPFEKQLTVLDGIQLPEYGGLSPVLHRSGRRGVWTGAGKIWVADTEKGEVLLTVEGTGGDYTADGLYFRYQAGEETVYLRWDTLEEVCRSTLSGQLSPDGKTIVTEKWTEGFVLWDAQSGEALWTEGHNSGNTLYNVMFAGPDTLIASHEEVQVYRISDRKVVYDSGKERTTYGLDAWAGRLVMPLRSGGCLVNRIPGEEETVPCMTVETREDFREEDLGGMTSRFPLAGRWNGMSVGFFTDQGWMTVEREEDGLVYLFGGKEYVLHPVNGMQNPFVYVSPDGEWQAVIRGGDVDIFRAGEGPEPVMVIPGNGYDRLCAAISGHLLALGSYVENLALYDLSTGDCVGTIVSGAMCTEIQFSPDGSHIIALSQMAEQAVVANTENLAVVMKIPVSDVYAQPSVGFTSGGTEAVVLYPDGHADVGRLYQELQTLVEKARRYTVSGP